MACAAACGLSRVRCGEPGREEMEPDVRLARHEGSWSGPRATEYIAVAAAAHFMLHPPHVDGPGKAKNANMNGRGVLAGPRHGP